MKVEELIIDGFKSYATRTVITDWDPQFNAITGLNGSGKSNILDAICFVLGIASMSTVRASSLQDLIYKRGQAGVTKASVTIVFDNTDKSNSPIGFTNSPQISVTRQVVLGGTSKYLINGHRAPQQSVLQLFQSVQLNINNPNFLIMQGKITKVLNMKPSEILSLIEEAAGTKMFEDRREKAERTMSKKETKLQENRTLLTEEIEPKLEKLRNEKRMFLEFQSTQTDLEKTERIVVSYDYYNIKHKHTSIRETLENGETRMKMLNEFVKKTSEEIDSLNEDVEEIKLQKEKELHKEGTISKLENKENGLLNEISRLKTSLSIKVENLNDTTEKSKALESEIASSSAKLIEKKSAYANTEKDYKMVQEQLSKQRDLYKRKEELVSTLTTGISSTGAADGGYNAQLAKAKTELNEVSLAIKKSSMKMELLKKELLTIEPKLKEATKDNELNVKHVKQCQETCDKLRARLVEYGFDPSRIKDLKQREDKLKSHYYQTCKNSEYLKRRVTNLEFNYTKPYPNFEASFVHGVVGQLFQIDNDNIRYATALQTCAGGRLFNVVVQDSQTATQLLERGRLRKRVTIIPLDKIYTRPISSQVLDLAKKIAPGKVELAINLIRFDESITKAMEFIFGNSLICEDPETAKKITFHPKIRARSITLQGDVYDPEGTLSGGSRNTSESLLVEIQKYNQIQKQIETIQADLNHVTEELQTQYATSQKTKTIQSDLNLSLHKLDLAKRNLDANPSSQIIARNEEILRDIGECENEIKTKQMSLKKCQEEVSTIEKDMKEYDSDKGSKLNELKKELKLLAKELEEQESESERKYDSFQNLELETEQLSSELDSNKTLLQNHLKSIESLKLENSDLEGKIRGVEDDLVTVQTELNEEKKRLMDIDDELNELETLIKKKQDEKKSSELELQKLVHDLNKYKSNTNNMEKRIEDLRQKHEFLEDFDLVTNIVKQNEGIDLDTYRERSKQLNEKFQELRKKVNPNIMNMIENVEKKEAALKTMIKTIEKDKMKIQETISKLNEYKRETLVKTWEKVTLDFGNIFADLLPNSFAKLVPCEGKDVTQGLEVKVKLGNIWKESLIELSGGQRSLIALSLIMALLQFRPAPMYILDEVDAALDLSHTQNIGHLIKTRFKGSQFIVVSLKEGMFANANRVFRTRFQDGTSVVSIM
ncbi:BCE_3a_G0018790.mRNA.1.CDS.1 [Saccharomyces cerevisiae]|nr:BCE_3a_G0018790.mRNA.1.CDS.1 [Saccharomyces cerevisiae]CAI7168185.1 BCE_3a_G0018790.mRNA.1.CDS.1 [Saccharomyces cerevisiae]